MKVFAPKYYLDFKCIKDKCAHSCCIGWEIDVDDYSMLKYKNLQNEYSKNVIDSLKQKPTPHFKLLKNGRCPHLDEKGLCKIIINCGEEFLCDICKEHPRFYNLTAKGEEVGLGMSCEEACRIILTSEEDYQTILVEEDERPLENLTFNPLVKRREIFDILFDERAPYCERLLALKEKFGINLLAFSDKKWKKVIKSLEYLDKQHREIFLNYSSQVVEDEKATDYLKRALGYFIYRHVSKSRSEKELKAYLGVCLFLERLLYSSLNFVKAQSLKEVIKTATLISEEIEYNEDNLLKIKKLFFDK